MSLSAIEKRAGIVSGIGRGLKSLSTLGKDLKKSVLPPKGNVSTDAIKGSKNMLNAKNVGESTNLAAGRTGKALSDFARRSPVMAYGAPSLAIGYGLGGGSGRDQYRRA